MKHFILFLFSFSLIWLASPKAMAQDAASAASSVAAASSAPVASAPVVAPSAGAKVQSAVDKIPVALPAWLLALIGVLSELAMRLWPTKSPKSWLLAAKSILSAIGEGCGKLSALLDLVIQNLKA